MARIVVFEENTMNFPVRTFMPMAPVTRFFSFSRFTRSAVASVRSMTCTPRRFNSLYSAGLKVVPHTRMVNLFS